MPTLTANGIDIYYELRGQGPPLTLIMGQSCSLHQWKWMADILSGRFQVITFDNRGAGRSEKPDVAYSTAMMATDTRCLLEKLGIAKSHVFGVSFGGMIAQKFALMYPDAVDRLILGATMPNYYRFPPTQETIEALQSSALLSLPEGVKIIMNLFYTTDFFSKHPARAEEIHQIMCTEKEEQAQNIMYRQMGAGMEHNTLNELNNIKNASLIICGDDDPITPVENSRYMATKIPRSTLAVLPDTRHAFWVERAEQASEIIKKFLAESSRRAHCT